MLLEKSLKSGRGINDRNIVEVETCLAMTAAERSARKAARELFNCLANGEQHITVAQLEKKMRQIYKLKSNGNRANQRDISPYQSIRQNVILNPSGNITEANLISAAMNYSNGQLPAISSSLTLSTPHPDTLNHIPYFHRLLLHPFMFIYLIYHKYLNFIAQLPGSPISCLSIALLVACFANVNRLFAMIPVLIYYVTLSVMIVSTFKMFKLKHNFDDFQMWSRLFLSFDQHVNTEASENQFLRREMQPYLVHFSAFFINVIVSPAIPIEWKLSSEMTILSFTLLFATLLVFMYNTRYSYPDPVVLLSFGLNVLVKFPYEMNAAVSNGWEFLDSSLPHFPTFLVGNGIEFCLNSRALLYLMIPAILLVLARRQNWHGIYQFLIPHCVTLSWLQICIISSQSATMFELIRGSLGLVALLFCMPLFGVVTLMIPVFAAVQSLALPTSTMRLIASISLTVAAMLMSCLLARYRMTKKYVTAFQILLCALATFYVSQPYLSSSSSPEDIYHQMQQNVPIDGVPLPPVDETWTNLQYRLFNRQCLMPLKAEGNRISAQLKCTHFDSVEVKWEGKVINAEISQMYNWRSHLLSYLPDVIASPIECTFGESNQIPFEVQDNEEIEHLKNVFKEQKRCNLNQWSTYEYRIDVSVDSYEQLHLKASHIFTNFTHSLVRGDRIWFKGKLSMSLADIDSVNVFRTGHEPNRHSIVVNVNSIGCIKCQQTDLRSVSEIVLPKLSGQNLFNGLKYLMNVLFNPLIKINWRIRTQNKSNIYYLPVICFQIEIISSFHRFAYLICTHKSIETENITDLCDSVQRMKIDNGSGLNINLIDFSLASYQVYVELNRYSSLSWNAEC